MSLYYILKTNTLLDDMDEARIASFIGAAVGFIGKVEDTKRWDYSIEPRKALNTKERTYLQEGFGLEVFIDSTRRSRTSEDWGPRGKNPFLKDGPRGPHPCKKY